ncbi:MAG TPA: ParA family protein [bacterium]|nr:ParA family protein [bacterium]HMW35299.1 ParA family protein [bacterium]HMY35106.1 ParA family protein [bacterium]HNB57796.1 ParA family protein [bacterium]HNC49962.1 ParA family protein [bacterium]
MPKVICVANPKGGVGKTTTSINLSASLAKFGKRALLIDLDPSGAASVGVGFTRENATFGVYDLYKHPESLDEAIVRKAIYASGTERLDVMPSNVWTSEEENELLKLSAKLTRLRIMINFVRNDYDYFIIDCPPFLSNLTLGAFTASDSTIVPVQCGFFALHALERLMKFYRKVRESINPYLKIEGILITMYEKGTNVSIKTVRDARAVFEDLVFGVIIPKNVKIGDAAFQKKPVVTYDSTSAGAKAYIQLAEVILHRDDPQWDIQAHVQTPSEPRNESQTIPDVVSSSGENA